MNQGEHIKKEVKFKTPILRSSLCHYSGAYILVTGTITITGVEVDNTAKRLEERNKRSNIERLCSIYWLASKIDNTQIDYTKDLDVVMSMNNLIEYIDNYSKTSESLWQYYRDKSADAIVNSVSFERWKITGKTPADGNTKYVEVTVPLNTLALG